MFARKSPPSSLDKAALACLERIMKGAFYSMHPNRLPPQRLHHYTNVDGFNGIIGEGRLRATHLAFMNDANEYRHAIDLVRESIKRRRGSNTDKTILELLATMHERLQDPEPADYPAIFVSSFSTEENDLAQWRAYGQAEAGVSIEFVGDRLETAAKKLNTMVLPVIYEQKRQSAVVQILLDGFIREYKNGLPRHPDKDMVQLRNEWINQFFWWGTSLAPMFKDSAFQSEHEWRIVYFVLDQVSIQTLPKHDHLSLYVNLDLRMPTRLNADQAESTASAKALLPISRVLVGPSRHAKLTQTSARALLERESYFGITVAISKTPFRKT